MQDQDFEPEALTQAVACLHMERHFRECLQVGRLFVSDVPKNFHKEN